MHEFQEKAPRPDVGSLLHGNVPFTVRRPAGRIYYLFRGKVFANAQTGNIVLMAVHAFAGEWGRVLHYLVPLCFFALGVFAAELMHQKLQNLQRLHWRQLVVLCEIVMLFVVGFFPQEWNLVANALVSFACAMQVQTFRKVNGYAFASTMCIGKCAAAWTPSAAGCSTAILPP